MHSIALCSLSNYVFSLDIFVGSKMGQFERKTSDFVKIGLFLTFWFEHSLIVEIFMGYQNSAKRKTYYNTQIKYNYS